MFYIFLLQYLSHFILPFLYFIPIFIDFKQVVGIFSNLLYLPDFLMIKIIASKAHRKFILISINYFTAIKIK